MPTYEYHCKACDHRFELFQSMSAKPVRTCPECGKKKVERLIGIGAAVLFKGSGFYQTDYRSDSYKKSADADKKPAPGDAAPKESAKPSTSDSATKTEAPKSEPAKAPAKAKSKKDK